MSGLKIHVELSRIELCLAINALVQNLDGGRNVTEHAIIEKCVEYLRGILVSSIISEDSCPKAIDTMPDLRPDDS